MGSPEGEAWLGDTAVMCHHVGNTQRKTDSLAFSSSQSNRKADKETDWGGGWGGGPVGEGFLEMGIPGLGLEEYVGGGQVNGEGKGRGSKA